MAKYILSPNAQDSLCGIKLYSTNHFGERQTRIYLEEIHKRMREVAENPQKGKSRNALLEGYYSINAGSHVIYYTIKNTHIDIVDILHQRMEPLRHLYAEPEDD